MLAMAGTLAIEAFVAAIVTRAMPDTHTGPIVAASAPTPIDVFTAVVARPAMGGAVAVAVLAMLAMAGTLASDAFAAAVVMCAIPDRGPIFAAS